MAALLVLHGPNLNLLGTREPEVYGRATLSDINARLKNLAEAQQHTIKFIQSNAEHILIDAIHEAVSAGVKYIIINPAAFTHTSIALRDAFAAVSIPFIEVHLSNTHARERFRKQSYLSELAKGIIMGFGATSYELALNAAMSQLNN